MFKRSDGAMYASNVETTIVGGQATLLIVATDAGQAGNGEANITLTLDSPIAGDQCLGHGDNGQADRRRRHRG